MGATFRWALWVTLLAALAAFLFSLPGRVLVALGDLEVETPLALALAGILALAVALRGLVRLGAWVRRAVPGERGRSARAAQALARGHVAAAAGDGAGARRESLRAQKLAPDQALPALILRAEAAEIEGDPAAAAAVFDALSDDPATRFLGLKGRLRLALKNRDGAEARALAREAFELMPGSVWAADALVALAAAAGDFELGRATIDRALGAKAYDRTLARRRRALIAHAAAEIAEAAGDRARARREALDAHDLVPDLGPYAIAAARAEAGAGSVDKGLRLLEAAFAARPQPDLARAAAELGGLPQPAIARERVEALCRKRPRHVESALALARAALDADDFAAAETHLAPFAGRGPGRAFARHCFSRASRGTGAGGPSPRRGPRRRVFSIRPRRPSATISGAAGPAGRGPMPGPRPVRAAARSTGWTGPTWARWRGRPASRPRSRPGVETGRTAHGGPPMIRGRTRTPRACPGP